MLRLQANRFVYFLHDLLIVPYLFGFDKSAAGQVKFRQQQQQHKSLAEDGGMVFSTPLQTRFLDKFYKTQASLLKGHAVDVRGLKMFQVCFVPDSFRHKALNVFAAERHILRIQVKPDKELK